MRLRHGLARRGPHQVSGAVERQVFNKILGQAIPRETSLGGPFRGLLTEGAEATLTVRFVAGAGEREPRETELISSPILIRDKPFNQSEEGVRQVDRFKTTSNSLEFGANI